MGGGLESRCVGRVDGADGAVRVARPCTAPSAPYTATLKKTTHPKTRCRKPYASTQHLMLLMMGLYTPKYVELRIHQQNQLVATSWYFTLFHEEDARSNNPQIYGDVFESRR